MINKILKKVVVWLTIFVIIYAVLFFRQVAKATPHVQKADIQNIEKSVDIKLDKNKNKSSYDTNGEKSLDTVDAKSYILVDLDSKKVLLAKNEAQRLPIASLTKIMTAVVALDLADPSELFTVTQSAADQVPTKIGVVPNQKMSLSELMNAMLITSANDAVSVIQQGIDNKYGSSVFVNAMNEKAKLLGLTNTHFQNPQGYDSPQNYSSSYDLAVLTEFAIDNYPLIKQIVKKDYNFLPQDANHKQFDLYNWNGLLDVYPNTVGVKIGNTDEALKTTVVMSERGGKRLLAVVLGTADLYGRDLGASSLLDAGYSTTMGLAPVGVTQAMLQAKYNTWKYF